MVGMVMCDKHMVNVGTGDAVFEEVFLEGTQSHTDIDEQGIAFGPKQIAIATAPTSKGYEFKHLQENSRAKLRKRVDLCKG